MPKDNRIYITEKGIARYLDAVAKQQDIEITHMIIDSVLLPDNADPKKVEKIAKPAHTPFPAHVKRVGNTLMMMSDAPVGVGDFHIWGVAFALADGTVFAYARGLGDYKTKTDPLRIKFEVSSLNGDNITNNYDASALFVTYEDLNEHQSAVDEKMMSDAVAFCRSESQQTQQAKQHMALSKKVDDLKPADAADIDAKASGLIKYVNLSMLWRALDANLREAKLHATLKHNRAISYAGTKYEQVTTALSHASAEIKAYADSKAAQASSTAKSYTDTKHGAAIHHTNTEKGNVIALLKSFVLQKLGEHQSAIDEKMMSDAVAFCRSESQQTQQAKQHMALSKKVADLKPADVADIDAKASGLIKYVNLSMLWRALAANLREAKLHTTLNCKRVMTAAKNHTNAKYSAAIHHTNTEKGKTITELKSFISSNYLSKSSSGATKSFGHSGYIKLPSFLGGLIIQYGGAYTKPGSGMRTPLPIRYPNSHLVCVGTFDNGTGHDGVTPMLLSKDLGGVTFGHHFTRQPRHVSFISIGY